MWPEFLLGAALLLTAAALLADRIIASRRLTRLATLARSLGWRLSRRDRFSLETRLANVSPEFSGLLRVRDVLYRPVTQEAHTPRLAFVATVHAIEETDGRPIVRRMVIATHETPNGLAAPTIERVTFAVEPAYRILAAETAAIDAENVAEDFFGGV